MQTLFHTQNHFKSTIFFQAIYVRTYILKYVNIPKSERKVQTPSISDNRYIRYIWSRNVKIKLVKHDTEVNEQFHLKMQGINTPKY